MTPRRLLKGCEMRSEAQTLADVIYANAVQLLDDEAFYAGPSTLSSQTAMYHIRKLVEALKTYHELDAAQNIALEMLSFRYNQACQTLREHNLIA